METTIEKYFASKASHSDSLPLVREGDFYVTFGSDAFFVARDLQLTLVHQPNTRQIMIGFPHHALEDYLPKLVRAGYRVKIIEESK